jgi:hypothetical protein
MRSAIVSDLKYQPIHRIPKEQLMADLESSNPQAVANALYGATKYETDTAWVQDQCLRKLTSSELVIRWGAATCLGDLAFLRRPLNTELVIPALERAAEDHTIADPAKFSLSMIKEFLS